MRRITNFFGGSDSKDHQRNAPPTPPLAPDIQESTVASTLGAGSRSRASTLRSADGGSGDSLPLRGGLTLLTPTSASSTPYLQPLPSSPIAAPSPSGYSRPGTSSGFSGFGSRPGTSSGYSPSGGSMVTVQPTQLPRLRKKRNGRFGKKKDSETQQIAWRLAAGSTANLEAYDVGPLLRGEPAKELWYPGGDTLVYLTPREKRASPVFRIHSCPLMFNALSGYIVDLRDAEQSMEHSRRTSQTNDLYLEVPTLTDSPGSVDMDTSDATDPIIGTVVDRYSPRPDNNSPIGSYPHSLEGRGITKIAPEDFPQPQKAEIVHEDDYEDESSILYKLYFPVLPDDLPPRPVTPSKKLKKQPKTSKADAQDTLQRYIDARNLFAFLSRAHLVASQSKELPFDILSKIFVQLNLQEADNFASDLNTSNNIHVAEGHLQTYIDELRLDDVRNDDDAIVEALVMGEKWRSMRLYHEGFIHASGRWVDIDDHPGLVMVSPTTIARLDRGSLDLNQIRLVNIRLRIPNFEFPSVWIGEGRYPEYKSWRIGYDRMRSLVMNHMKYVFGSWPPRAGRHGKGGGVTESGGLNRAVLKRLYDDVCHVYDLTVDREWLHGERIHFEGTRGSSDCEDSNEAKAKNERHREAMRKIMDEFDKCSVPVQPEMPFSLPRLPYRLPSASKKKKMGLFSKSSKKVKADEIRELLQNSYNQDSLEEHSDNGLVKAFEEMEREYGTGKTIEDLIAARRGAWVFMYCLLQSLVIVVVDGQGLRYGDGVEYFLCENVKGIPPWEKGSNRRQARMTGMWMTGPDGTLLSASGMSSTANLGINPDDEIDMTYRRSHCWLAAEEWRLVRADPDDEDYEQLYEYQEGYREGYPESSAGYSSEYTPGQQTTQSPRLEDHPSNFAPYSDELQRLQLDGHDSQGYQLQQHHGGHPAEYQGHLLSPVEEYQQNKGGLGWQGQGYQNQAPYARSMTSSQLPLPMTPPMDEQPRTLHDIDIQPFDFELAPTSSKSSPEQSRSVSPAPGVGLQYARTWSPAQPSTIGNMRKSSAPVSGTSSPLRYSPVMGQDGRSASPYSAYSSSRGGSPVPPPQTRAKTLPRRY